MGKRQAFQSKTEITKCKKKGKWLPKNSCLKIFPWQVNPVGVG